MKSVKSRQSMSPGSVKAPRKAGENQTGSERKPAKSCNTSFREVPALRVIQNTTERSLSPIPSSVDSELRLRVKEIEEKTQRAQAVLEKEALLILRIPENLLQKVQQQGEQLHSLTAKLMKTKDFFAKQLSTAQTALHHSQLEVQRLTQSHEEALSEVQRLTEQLKEDRPSCSDVGQWRLKIQQLNYLKSVQDAEIARLNYDNDVLKGQVARANTVELAYYKLQQDYLALEHAFFLANSKLKNSASSTKTVDRLKKQLETAQTELAQVRKNEKSKDLELQTSTASIKALRAQLFASSQQLERSKAVRASRADEEASLRRSLEQSIQREVTLMADVRKSEEAPLRKQESDIDLQACQTQLYSAEWRLASAQERLYCLEQVCQSTQQACERLKHLVEKAEIKGELGREIELELKGIRKLGRAWEEIGGPKRSKSSGELVVIK